MQLCDRELSLQYMNRAITARSCAIVGVSYIMSPLHESLYTYTQSTTVH